MHRTLTLISLLGLINPARFSEEFATWFWIPHHPSVPISVFPLTTWYPIINVCTTLQTIWLKAKQMLIKTISKFANVGQKTSTSFFNPSITNKIYDNYKDKKTIYFQLFTHRNRSISVLLCILLFCLYSFNICHHEYTMSQYFLPLKRKSKGTSIIMEHLL